MDFRSLPNDMQEKVLKLASEHAVIIEEAKNCFLMGGDHADILCKLVAAKIPYSYIELQNHALWADKNKKIIEELNNLSV
jgi:hypothetical protein